MIVDVAILIPRFRLSEHASRSENLERVSRFGRDLSCAFKISRVKTKFERRIECLFSNASASRLSKEAMLSIGV